MLFFNGNILRNIRAIAFLVLFVLPNLTKGQDSILDSTFTFRSGTVNIGNAFSIITRTTGYSFTYDSRLINTEKRAVMNFTDMKLGNILDSILNNDSLAYSVIDRYIIISRKIFDPRPEPHIVDINDMIYIEGVVIDAESFDPLPYATIGLKNKGRGTVSNSNGEFGINISPTAADDTLVISYLGFYGREIPIGHLMSNKNTIGLQREFISIPEIIIRNQIPQEIIYKALSAIPKNYGKSPAYLAGFYREGILKKNKLQTYSEAILKIYKSSYSGSLWTDQIKVLKSRKIDNVSIKDTLAVRLKAGLSTSLELDGIKNIFDFIKWENIPDYSYRIADIVSYDEESAYLIEFSMKGAIAVPEFSGSMYINTNDYAILHVDFEITPGSLQKMKNSFISNTARRFVTWPVSVKYSISYRKILERYFLSHVRGDLIFNSRQKERLFSTQFNVFLELAVTGIDIHNVTRFEREELAPIHSVFSKTITGYDPLFWGSQDFLKPEDNLLQALKNMKVKLQEFTEEDN